FFEGFSAVRNAMRTTSSGTTTAISDPLNPASDNSWRTTGRAASAFEPPVNSAANLFAILVRPEFTPATATYVDVISHAQWGAWGLKTSVMVSTRLLLNERDLIDFLQRRDACKDFRKRRLAQGTHAFLVRRSLDL